MNEICYQTANTASSLLYHTYITLTLFLPNQKETAHQHNGTKQCC